ncbi:S-adenosyl-L-methionine-dependent methyltransferase [Lophium mytilinum]|uniref:S-adenosyl-L-methionine-dependent methyltransferase n=1 Tax=Lophium mytilinum TaxID=390894 RepID=A0A6A6RCT4_9PEZI|nr:S-adenosyl-L-methionine-dependent methyltransferase [Lophium mytilinum]
MSSDPQPPAPAPFYTVNEVRTRLQSHFLDADPSQHPSRWDDLWKSQDFLPWDRGTWNPALADVLSEQTALLGTPTILDEATGVKRRKRALVPGCGKGYDVLLLASFGYDSYGVEASANAVRACEKYAADAADAYPARDTEVGSGSVKFLFGDFFKDEWVEGVDGGLGDGFDVIYDYTFLCALPPSLRPSWAARQSQLLAPTARLICLEFPTHKSPSSGGPPWALPPVVYEEILARPGEEVTYDEDMNVIVQTPVRDNEKALERLAHWQPERTHEAGIGTDWVSIWKHKY